MLTMLTMRPRRFGPLAPAIRRSHPTRQLTSCTPSSSSSSPASPPSSLPPASCSPSPPPGRRVARCRGAQCIAQQHRQHEHKHEHKHRHFQQAAVGCGHAGSLRNCRCRCMCAPARPSTHRHECVQQLRVVCQGCDDPRVDSPQHRRPCTPAGADAAVAGRTGSHHLV